MHQLIQHYSEGPNIGPRTVVVAYESFGGHVEWRANAEISEGLTVSVL
jgi:hypothetical protein